jgi:hypothetical protein
MTAAGTYSANPILHSKAGFGFGYVGSSLVFEQQMTIPSDIITPGPTISYRVFSFYDVLASELVGKALLITEAYIIMGARLTGAEGIASSGGGTTVDLGIAISNSSIPSLGYSQLMVVPGQLIYTTGTSPASMERIFTAGPAGVGLAPALVGVHGYQGSDYFTDVSVQITNVGIHDIVNGTFRVVIVAIEV